MRNGSGSDDKQSKSGVSQGDLTERLAQLAEVGSDPERDFWPAIRQAIEDPPRQTADTMGRPAPHAQDPPDVPPRLEEHFAKAQREVSRWRWAAAVMLLLGVAILSSQLLPKPSMDWRELVPQQRSVEDLPNGSSAEVRRLLALYLEEREALLRSIAAALNDYPAELKQDIRENLELMEGAMVEIERSVAEHSTEASRDAEMPELAALYARELRLLRDVDARLHGRAADREL